MVVLPSIIVFRAFWISNSVSVSMLAVASSMTRIFGSMASVLAKLNSCLWPADKVEPLSVTASSYFSGSLSMNVLALTAMLDSTICSSVMSGLSSLMLLLMSPVKMNTSCCT